MQLLLQILDRFREVCAAFQLQRAHQRADRHGFLTVDALRGFDAETRLQHGGNERNQTGSADQNDFAEIADRHLHVLQHDAHFFDRGLDERSSELLEFGSVEFDFGAGADAVLEDRRSVATRQLDFGSLGGLPESGHVLLFAHINLIALQLELLQNDVFDHRIE